MQNTWTSPVDAFDSDYIKSLKKDGYSNFGLVTYAMADVSDRRIRGLLATLLVIGEYRFSATDPDEAATVEALAALGLEVAYEPGYTLHVYMRDR